MYFRQFLEPLAVLDYTPPTEQLSQTAGYFPGGPTNLSNHDEVTSQSPKVSPVQSLPTELLAEIFVRSLQDGDTTRTASDKAPLLLCQICRTWRQVAFSTPMLWCFLSFDVTAATLDSRSALTNMFIQRAGTLPLSIFMCGRGYVLPRIVARNLPRSPVKRIIIPYLHRWKSIKLDLPGYLLGAFFKQLNGSLAVLDTLEIDTGATRWGSSATVFEATPSLRRVSLRSNRMLCDPHLLHLPWSRLEDLTLDNDHSPWQCLSILHMCPNLVTCRLTILQFSDDIYPEHIFLSHLRVLELTTDRDLQTFVDSLTLPALETLEIKGNEADYPLWYLEDSLLPLFSRSSCVLKTFGIRFMDWEDGCFMDFLDATPFLVKLVVEDVDFMTDHILERMTYRGEADTPIPALTFFELVVHGAHIHDHVLETMIASRWWPDAEDLIPHQISRLDVADVGVLFRDVDPGVASRLSDIRAEGLAAQLRRIVDEKTYSERRTARAFNLFGQ